MNEQNNTFYSFLAINTKVHSNGDLMIFDHNDIDIIVMTEKNKVVAFAKDLMTEVVYGAESRLFEFLWDLGFLVQLSHLL